VLRIEPHSGDSLRALLPQLAGLRIEVFRDWPYLYDGDLAYEERYLGSFAAMPDHVAICAFDGDALVGAATAAPLSAEHEEFTKPFRDAGEAVDEIFYFSESILRSAYRGQGIGHAFFDGREAHAKALGFGKTAFCGVMRAQDHPLRPADHSPLDPFWRKRGYRPLPGIIAHFSWRDVDRDTDTSKPMQFWGRGFDRAS
jgi:GNAT superfamily N-acetyltransferase